jgi:hypothetical protein
MSRHGPLALPEVKKPPNALRIALSSAPVTTGPSQSRLAI